MHPDPFYRYLYKGEAVQAHLVRDISKLRGLYRFPDGQVLIRCHSSFAW